MYLEVECFKHEYLLEKGKDVLNDDGNSTRDTSVILVGNWIEA